jgi:hypothetical protein
VTTDEAHDAVFGTVTDREEVGPIDIVPVAPWLDLSVDRGRSEVLRAFSIEGAATARGDGVDLRWFSQLVGSSLADAAWYVLRSVESVGAEATVEVEVEDDPRRDYLRLNYLFNIVHTAGWAGEGGWQMSNGWTVGDVLGPLGLDRDVMRSAEQVVRAVLEGGTEGRAETRVHDLGEQGLPGDGLLNLIPSDLMGPCTDALIVLCFDRDNLERRLNEAIKHAGIHCPATRAVVFVTSKWDPKVWAELERDIVAVRASFSVMMRGPSGQLTRLR